MFNYLLPKVPSIKCTWVLLNLLYSFHVLFALLVGRRRVVFIHGFVSGPMVIIAVFGFCAL